MIIKPFALHQWEGYCSVKARLILWQFYAAMVAFALLVILWILGVDFTVWWVLAPLVALSLKVAADMVGIAILVVSGWLE